jgi:hypothetical protein
MSGPNVTVLAVVCCSSSRRASARERRSGRRLSESLPFAQALLARLYTRLSPLYVSAIVVSKLSDGPRRLPHHDERPHRARVLSESESRRARNLKRERALKRSLPVREFLSALCISL